MSFLKKVKSKKKSGFTLIELSMVLVIVGTLFSSGLIAYQALLLNSRSKITEENINTVYKALGNYLVANRKLPCPASLILPENNASYGLSIGSDGSCSGSPGETVTSSTATNLVYGMVPVKTLGLSNLIAKDGFNTKLSYIVDKRFTALVDSTGTTGFEGSDPNAANMINIKELSNSGTDIITNGIMLILSHGTNKLGGFNSSGTSQNNPISATTDEKDNAINNYPASPNFDKIFVTNSTDALFDDILIFKNKMQLAIDAGFENMMCRGTLASDYKVELSGVNPAANYGTNNCYNKTLSINLVWNSANYGEIAKTTAVCPTGCTSNLNTTSPGYPLRRCNKYGIWSKVIYPCYDSGSSPTP